MFGGAAVQDYKYSMHLPQSGLQWFENLSMLYLNWIPLSVEPRLAPPTWALTTEIFFYTLIGIGLSRSRFLTLLWLAGSAAFFLTVIALDWGSVWIYGAISGGSFPFALGATVFHYREQIEAWLDKARAGVAVVLFGRWGGSCWAC